MSRLGLKVSSGSINLSTSLPDTWPEWLPKSHRCGRLARYSALMAGTIANGVLTARATSSEEKDMLALQEATQNSISLIPIALVAITGAIVFWRVTIKIMAIGLILLTLLGLFDLLQSLH